ncbi:MAG: ribbon-helix-helix domain-containing protein [Pseudomonadota bacterium]
MEDTVRWSLKVSRDTDEALRVHLGRTGGRKGDLSKFVQEAVRERLRMVATPEKRSAAARANARQGLSEALAEVRARTRNLSYAQIQRIVAEAVAYARKSR